MRFRAEGDNVEEALKQYLSRQGLELSRLEGDGDSYAWFASNEDNEQIKGMMNRVGEGEYEMEIMPTLDEVADH
jgi:hypothetical protein